MQEEAAKRDHRKLGKEQVRRFLLLGTALAAIIATINFLVWDFLVEAVQSCSSDCLGTIVAASISSVREAISCSV